MEQFKSLPDIYEQLVRIEHIAMAYINATLTQEQKEAFQKFLDELDPPTNDTKHTIS